MKIEIRRITALTLAIALWGGCDTEHHKLGGTDDGLDGGSGAAGGAGNEGGAGGGTGAGSGAAGGAEAGTGAGGTVDAGTGGVGGFSGTIGDPPDASDAGNDDGGDGPSCSCGTEPISPGASFFAGVIDLSCFCQRFGCLSYDESRDPVRCVGFSRTWVSTFSNCDLVEIEIGGGLGGVAYTYDGTSHELVGAYKFDDVPTFACENTTVHAIRAGTRPSSTCTRLDRVNLCE